ncbi:ABC transporter permease [bacterium]|nr:ABC transporter permease [bacterium]
MFKYLTGYAFRQLTRFGLQSLLAILGVTIGVANIILLISITDLGRRQVLSMIGDFGANLLIIAPYMDLEQGPFSGVNPSQLSAHLPAEILATVLAADEIDAVAGALLLPGHISHGEDTTFATVQGTGVDFRILRGHEPDSGRWLSEADEAAHARVVCLGSTVRRTLFGEADPLGSEVTIKGETLTVIGTMEHKGRIGLEDLDNRVYIPLGTAQELYEFNSIHGLICRYRQDVSEEDAVAAVKRQLATLVKPGEDLDTTFMVVTIKEARQLLNSTLGLFRAVLAGIASIALLVAGLGIMNVMLIRVTQRRLEIGLRKAMGATNRDIVLQFLLEGGIQALIGAVCGIALGIGGVHFYCIYAEWNPYVSLATLVTAVVFGLATGLIFSAYPALRAARLDPIQALRQEY